jgi:hypothetical protein
LFFAYDGRSASQRLVISTAAGSSGTTRTLPFFGVLPLDPKRTEMCGLGPFA